MSINAETGKTKSPTEGVITADYLGEKGIQTKCMNMLARLMSYAKSIYVDAGKNHEHTDVGYFKAISQGQSNEDGVRTNADFAMTCAFIYKYGKAEHVVLPADVSYRDILMMARKALAYAYSTHRSNRLMTTTDNTYWGSDTTKYVWESSLWTESIAFCAWMLRDELSVQDMTYIKRLISAEADCDLKRDVPTGYIEDTKAEENGWETNVLAAACSLCSENKNADAWYEKMKSFAMNSYSMSSDSIDTTRVGGRMVKEWFRGTNLYADGTLQNHGYFHTSYQNVVIQELSESYLALKMMQPRFLPADNLLWHQQLVMDNVLKWLALADGELAMPNGNDWSMFLYDQLPAYASMATIFHDRDALMLENMALKYIEARQTTTPDGSWMLNSDIGPRRMGVTAHRVMMTYLFHSFFPVNDLKPTVWSDFQQRHAMTKLFPCQNIVRSMSEERFACFSFSKGLNDFTGIIVPNLPDRNKIIVPYKSHNTGNLLGYYDNVDNTDGKMTDIRTADYSWTASGTMKATSGHIPYGFNVIATDNNAVIVIDALKAKMPTSVSAERGGTLAISVDPFTRTERTIYHAGGSFISDGSKLTTFVSTWANIDNNIGIVSVKSEGTASRYANEPNRMAFGERELLNSIYTAKLYPSYSDVNSPVNAGINHSRCFIYFVNVTAEQTRNLADKITFRMDNNGNYTVSLIDTNGKTYHINGSLTF
jgi:hypothetical protein